ncbi:AAA family ATPase [Pseudomonas sp. R-28-1W-6]|uniref:ATP-binding protein n=1 Tax=Pseudomonas sp. R-28-1W-6 TaxID=2650101 RepID=UPI00136601DB|nr:winged helix-turn-helix domain-containing protein [Pseudomonas sp. R-28-1W-6]MWV11722.1 AAA family ATPase [Pseudomonas sp. R-28-1W-6]
MNRNRINHTDVVLLFGPFRYYVQRRQILNGDRPMRVGSRALDILHLLIEHAGSVVSKEALMARVWPTTVVEEINLRVHIAALRRALADGEGGQRYIANIPQRGYSFVADVQVGDTSEVVHAELAREAQHNLMGRLSPIVGREAVVDDLVRKLPTRRLLTLVGPGGVGKTTVALRVAELLLPHYEDGVYFIDLSTLVDPALIAAKVVSTLGLARLDDGARCGLARHLLSRHSLLVLDNCEHLIEGCAVLAEGLLMEAPRLTILATSREPLMAEAECVKRIEGLVVPPPEASNLEHVLDNSAVRLFVSLVLAHCPDFVLRQQDAPILIDICRQLDGLPLALELAASQVEVLGLNGLLNQLERLLELLTHGRRTAPARHQSLRAVLDWSYDLLSPLEQAVLRRFAVFKVAISLDNAVSFIVCEQINEAQVFEAITQLVSKSWLAVELVDSVVHYHLQNIARVYALEKLKAGEEYRDIQKRYAQQRNIRVIEGLKLS